MLPVLAGGVSAAESARAGISLVAIILFALTLQLIHAALLLMSAGARLRRQICEPIIAEAPSFAGTIEQRKRDYFLPCRQST